MLPKKIFSDPEKKWLDAGAGTGFFSMRLYWRLDEGLSSVIIDKEERHNHIIENMISLSELRHENILKLREIFGEKANIFEGNFLELKGNYDYIIGNPPYNTGDYPAFDAWNQYIGEEVPLDKMFHLQQKAGKLSDNAMDTNWGGPLYSEEQVATGKYSENEVNIWANN